MAGRSVRAYRSTVRTAWHLSFRVGRASGPVAITTNGHRPNRPFGHHRPVALACRAVESWDADREGDPPDRRARGDGLETAQALRRWCGRSAVLPEAGTREPAGADPDGDAHLPVRTDRRRDRHRRRGWARVGRESG